MPGFPSSYGHLHINLIKDRRTVGGGTVLMETYFNYLKKKKVEGVFAQVFKQGSQKSYNFFKSFGMQDFEERNNTLWKDFVQGDVKLVTLVKKL